MMLISRCIRFPLTILLLTLCQLWLSFVSYWNNELFAPITPPTQISGESAFSEYLNHLKLTKKSSTMTDSVEIQKWVTFFSSQEIDVVIVPGRSRDGFGHRLLRLYHTIAFFHAIGVHDVKFAGFPPKFEHDGFHIPVDSINHTVYCHSIQPIQNSISLFEKIPLPPQNLNNGLDRYESFFKIYSLEPDTLLKSEMNSWIQSLKCEEIPPIETLLNISTWENEITIDPDCIFLPSSTPDLKLLNACEYLVFELHSIKNVVSPRNDILAKQHFQPFVKWLDSTEQSNCNFTPEILDVSVHLRLGDKISPQVVEEAQTMLDSIIEMMSFSSAPNHHTRLHIFTETKEDCPAKNHSFVELPSIKVEGDFCDKHCIGTPKLCPGLPSFNGTCSNPCKNPQNAFHLMKHRGPRNPWIVSRFSAQYNPTDKTTHIPVSLHTGGSMQDDLRCLAKSDILVVACSSLAQLAATFSKGIKISQDHCTDWRDMGRDYGKIIFLDLKDTKFMTKSNYGWKTIDKYVL